MGAFSIFTDKRNKKKQSGLPTVEEYYLRLARRTTLVKFICIMLLTGFALFAFSNYRDELTIENARYVLKFVNFGPETVQEKASVVYFDSDPNNKGELLRGDLAVLNKEGVAVYDFNGTRLLKSDFRYDHPKMVSTQRNIVICDMGGYGLRVINSFSTVYTQTFSYPILGLSASESGRFVVVSSAKGYRSAFFVYDEHCRVIYTYYFGDKYIDCAAISPDGREIAVLLHYSQNGQLVTLLSKFSVDDDQPVFQAEFAGELPLQIRFLPDGSYAFLTSDALRFFSGDNQNTSEIFFEEKSLLGYEFSDNYVIMTYNAVGLSAGTEMDVYRKDGTLAAIRSFDGALLDKKVAKDTLYVLLHGSLISIDLGGETGDITAEVDSEFRQIIPDGESVILFSDKKAEYYKSGRPDTGAQPDTED